MERATQVLTGGWPGTRVALVAHGRAHEARPKAPRPSTRTRALARAARYLPLSEEEPDSFELDPLAVDEALSFVPEFEPDAVLSPEDES